MVTRHVRNVVLGMRKPSHSFLEVRCVYDNLGDIMVAQAIRQLFDNCSLVTGEPTPLFRGLHAVLGLRRVFRYTCLGGGTLIFGPPEAGWLESLEYFSDRTTPLCTIGTGVIDPRFRTHAHERNADSFVVDEHLTESWLKCLRRFRFLSVRGTESERILREHGIADIEVVGDPAILFSPAEMGPRTSGKTLGVNVSRTSDFWMDSQEHVQQEVTLVLKKMMQDGWAITLFPTVEDDLLLARQVAADLGGNVSIHNDYQCPQKYIEAINKTSVFLGTKLHAVVCAFCAYTPAIMIGYQPKCYDFMKTMGFENWFVRSDAVQADRLVEMCRQAHRDADMIRQKQHRVCQEYRNRLHAFRDRVLSSIDNEI